MRKQLFFLLLLISPSCLLLAQQKTDTSDALNGMLANLKKYQQQYPQEKVYLHMDKPYYVAGEDIWFKAYVTVSQFNFLSAVSKIMYVELINNSNEIVQSRRLPVISGLAVGDFKLPDTLAEGSYRVRAYTNWMRNFDDDFFFDKTFVIGNSMSDGLITSSEFTLSKNEKEQEIVHSIIKLKDLNGEPVGERQVNYEIKLDAKSTAKGKAKFDETGTLNLDFASKDGVDVRKGFLTLHIENMDRPPIVKRIPIQVAATAHAVQFYPESGALLSNIFSKVGFKATQGEGKGAKVTGYVESEGERIVDFSSDHAGMGNFSLAATADREYIAVVEFEDGEQIKTNLPAPLKEGFGLAVNNAVEDAVWIQVAASPSIIKGQQISVIAQTNGQVFYAAKSKLEKSDLTVSIPRKSIPSGVVKISLLDEQMDLVADRAIFNINPEDILPLQLEANKQSYTRREKVDLKIKATGINDSTRVGTFSIAVTNMDKVPDSAKKEISILSTLLLSTDTKGYIERPGYYFEEENAAIKRQMDNLMLTQLPDQSFWQNIKDDNLPELSYKSEKEIRISGTITKSNGDPVDKAKVTVISPQNASVMDTLTGPDGRFNFDKIIFYDSTNFVVQARDARGRKNVEIKLDEVPKQQVSQNRNSPDVTVDANQSLGSYLEDTDKSLEELQKYGFLERSIVLEEVEVRDKKENPAKYSANLNGPGRADQIISGDEVFFNGCPTLDVCLNGRLVGVIFRNGIPYSMRSQNQPMQIILDGMYMDASALNIINPFDVASVEVLRTIGNTAIYGMYGSGGVLIITTRRGDQPRNFSRELFTPGITTFSPQGFYEIREFYSPDYSTPEAENGDMSDLRSTIYWKPDIVTNENGEAAISFYTADEPGMYQIVVEGLDTEGHIGRVIRYIRVE
ncbi:TonB-dependent receptor plug domain-containing protein [Olivibacter sp. SDN3]|uniref:TonB-dependent receptor plug domain-containing protein n=1 Tax=Olivibacter sp. SDN3 TaxID=2764720 RepID=UPI001651A627|nr:TonB-dependent receptor plug domain-containing protein [Olivibacter sp. SDN3]QNL51297.1 TonB-dependent receptor plug domain-containing protein [Olivibacter sp. SDN3]